jgi:uncharacterized protein (DUF1330 family)
MSAYVVLFRESEIRDPAEMAKYTSGSQQRASSVKFTPLVVYGAQTLIEGDKAPDGVVVLQFDSVEDAKKWYYSDEYQSAVKHRLAAADYRGVIVEGFTMPT